jgi:hypothetical protein
MTNPGKNTALDTELTYWRAQAEQLELMVCDLIMKNQHLRMQAHKDDCLACLDLLRHRGVWENSVFPAEATSQPSGAVAGNSAVNLDSTRSWTRQ